MAQSGAKPVILDIPRDPREVRVLGRICIRRILLRFKREVSEREVARWVKVLSRRHVGRIRQNPNMELSLKTYKKLIRRFNPAPPKKKRKPFASCAGLWYGDAK